MLIDQKYRNIRSFLCVFLECGFNSACLGFYRVHDSVSISNLNESKHGLRYDPLQMDHNCTIVALTGITNEKVLFLLSGDVADTSEEETSDGVLCEREVVD